MFKYLSSNNRQFIGCAKYLFAMDLGGEERIAMILFISLLDVREREREGQRAFRLLNSKPFKDACLLFQLTFNCRHAFM